MYILELARVVERDRRREIDAQLKHRRMDDDRHVPGGEGTGPLPSRPGLIRQPR